LEVIRARRICQVYFSALLLIISFSAVAQPGGKSSFEFVNVPGNARLAGMGGVNVSLADRDVNFFSSNPALSSDSLDHFAAASYQAYVAKIGHAFISYQHPFPKLGSLTFAVQHINYGTIQGYDQSGTETAEFNSGETALYISKSHQIGNFRLGATIKGAFSNLAGYRASAMMMDIGGAFIHPQKNLTVGLVIKNLGAVISDYRSANKSSLPFDVQLGVTVKPEHMPIRFSFTGYQLARDISYSSGADDEKPGTIKKILEHVNFGGEILIHKNVNILVGYNYLIHETLKLSSGGGGAGLSIGFSAAVKNFEFTFSRNAYMTGNAGYSFTLSTNMNKILKRR